MFYWVLLGLNGFEWVLLGFTGLKRALLGCFLVDLDYWWFSSIGVDTDSARQGFFTGLRPHDWTAARCWNTHSLERLAVAGGGLFPDARLRVGQVTFGPISFIAAALNHRTAPPFISCYSVAKIFLGSNCVLLRFTAFYCVLLSFPGFVLDQLTWFYSTFWFLIG